MPSKHPPTTVRFSPDELALLDELARALVPPGSTPLPRTDVLRAGLHLLAAERLPPRQPKKSQKKS